MKRTEALILSMTKQERQKPDILNASRRMGIANAKVRKCKSFTTEWCALAIRHVPYE